MTLPFRVMHLPGSVFSFQPPIGVVIVDRPEKKVIRIATRPVVALVEYAHTGRYWSPENLPGDPVDSLVSSFVPELSISLMHHSSCVIPTAVVPRSVEGGNEAAFIGATAMEPLCRPKRFSAYRANSSMAFSHRLTLLSLMGNSIQQPELCQGE